MIYPVLISLAIALACSEGSDAPDFDAERFATVTGVVSFEGVVPRLTVADDSGRYRPQFIVERETGGLARAVVSLSPLDAIPPPVADGDRPDPAIIDQIDFRFEPAVTAVIRGQPVLFGNGDAANHNVRTATTNPRNQMNIVTPPRSPYEKRFDSEKGGAAIALHCDIHAWMAGWIYVFDHPWFDVTGENGQFQIENVPPGRYSVRIEQPAGQLQAETEVTLSNAETKKLKCRFTVANLRAASAAQIQDMSSQLED